MQLEIATGFYQSDSLPLAAQRCINWIPIVPQAEALSQRALFEPWGIVQQTLTGDTINGLNRGSQVVNGVPYFVNGNNLYSFTSGGVVTDHGQIEGTGRVSLANNGQYLVIVDPGNKSYVFNNESSTLSQITDNDFVVADDVDFKDGYFIFSSSDGDIFFISNLNDPFTYTATDFSGADVRPDKIIGVHVNQNELFVAGEETIELFQNVGGSGFPFSRVEGADLQKGVHAKNSLINFDNSFVFLGGDVNELTAVWRYSGGGTEKISTSTIDNAIQEFTEDEISEAYAMTYAFGGNYFCAFTFESSTIPSKTFVYDATTSALTSERVWHERQSGVVDDKWRVKSIVSAYGDLYVGDSEDGRVGVLDKDTYDEYGEVIFRMKTSQPFKDQQMFPLFVSQMKLGMESGVGLISDDDAPQVRMDFSDDGARTWSNEFWRSYGQIGEYTAYPTWRRLGRVPRNRVVRFKTSEKVKSVVHRLDADFIQGVQM